MERYIFGSRSNIHIIDLSQTIPLLHQALVAVRDVAAKGGRVLFVGTKRRRRTRSRRPPSAAPSTTSTTAGSAAR
jgi:ribosomal protein S2